jgi:hypothetical protein
MMEKNEISPKKSPLEISERTREELSALFEGREWNGEKLPPVFLKLFSSPHKTAEDAEGIKKLLDESDIYIPEMYGWSGTGLSVRRKISNGEEFPPNSDDFDEKTEEYFFSTKKPITHIDVPDNEIAQHPELYGEPELYMRGLKHFSYEEAVKKVFEFTEECSKMDVTNREIYMVEHLSEQIKKLIKEYPELQKKDAIKILMTLGSGHSSIYFALRELGGEHVLRVFQNTPSRGYESEGIRRVGFKKEISKELKERALLENLFFDGMGYLFERLSKNTSKNEYFLRYVVSLFSSNEIKDAFTQWKEHDGDPVEILYFIMMKKGIIFPKTEEEMDEILASTPYGKYQKTLEEIKNNKKNESKI